jgi:hypothetical protein
MPSLRKNKTKHYLAMWDMLGLESLHDVDLHMSKYNEWSKQKIVAILKDERIPEQPAGIPLQMMILRAKYNSQRAYEIYEFTSTMDHYEIKEAFETDPQPIVEWIRENGKKVYSDYVKQNRKMIV